MKIKITLQHHEMTLRLGDSAAAVRQALGPMSFQFDADPQIGTADFLLSQDGLDIVLRNDVLSAVFFFITPEEGREDTFSGQVDLLPDDFFQQPSAEVFVAALTAKGFTQSTRIYPNNPTDMLTETSRLRFEVSKRGTKVLFDDGKLLREPQMYPTDKGPSQGLPRFFRWLVR